MSRLQPGRLLAALCSRRAASSAAASNALLDAVGRPRFTAVRAEDVADAVTARCAALEADLAKVEAAATDAAASSSADAQKLFDAAVAQPEEIALPLDHTWSVVTHLTMVKSEPKLRAAQDGSRKAVVEISTRMAQSKALYAALKRLHSTTEANNDSGSKGRQALDAVQRRIVAKKLQAAELSGVGLDEGRRAEFNALQLELSQLQAKFPQNVLGAVSEFSLLLTQEREVAGLPASHRALLAQSARSHGHPQASADAGPWRLTLDMPAYLPFMQYSTQRDLRAKVYAHKAALASFGPHSNAEILHTILRLRQQQARLLGYKTFADLSLAKKMATTVANVASLQDALYARCAARAAEEMNTLLQFAASHTHEGEVPSSLQPWDVPFWTLRMQEKALQIDDEALRAYFPLPRVLDGLFRLVQEVFGITIKADTSGQVDVWHPDVRFYHVYNSRNKKDSSSASDGEPIAAFYLDPYSRPAEKNGGAWMDVCLHRTGKNIPTAYMICNQSPPLAGGGPALMTFREVETLFHEFGHALQHMLSEVPYLSAAGINLVEWDAVEIASQLMESWCYHFDTLQAMTSHATTGEALPRELFERLQQRRRFMAGVGFLNQLRVGDLDLQLHHSYDPMGARKSAFDFQRELMPKYSALPPLSDRFLCSFSHIFGGGYAAGYFSYKWAEVLAADAFSRFEEALQADGDRLNGATVQKVGKDYRSTFLALGGGTHPSEVFRKFRGRDPSVEPLLHQFGL